MKRTALIMIVAVSGLCAATVLATLCTVYSSVSCLYPPLGMQQGCGYCPKCDCYFCESVDVAYVPTKTWAQWQEKVGKDNYSTGTTQCEVSVNQATTCPCCDQAVTVQFVVTGSPENTTWPSGNPCNPNG
jgi:hypothetical protein